MSALLPKADMSLKVAALHDIIPGVAYLLSKMASAGLIFPEARNKLDVVSSWRELHKDEQRSSDIFLLESIPSSYLYVAMDCDGDRKHRHLDVQRRRWLAYLTSFSPALCLVSLVEVAVSAYRCFCLRCLPARLPTSLIKRRFIPVSRLLFVGISLVFAALVTANLVSPQTLLLFMFFTGALAALEAPSVAACGSALSLRKI